MSNDDITRLTDGLTGLQFNGPAKQIVDGYGLAARDELKSMLSDPDRFAAAHAALAEITGVKTGGMYTLGPLPRTGTANRLNYHLDLDRNLSFRVDENLHLYDWWITTVGDHTGIQVWDEENEKMVWLNELEK